MKRNISALLSLCLLAGSAWAQESAQTDKVTVNGSIQSDILIPQDDKAIGAEKDGDWAKTNTYVDLSAAYKHLGAGLRVEYLDHPLPGFEADMKGWGLMHAYLRLKYDRIDVTAGSFYEQFGSGFILRTYEDRNLGVDNALIGGRVIVKPTQGITIKAL